MNISSVTSDFKDRSRIITVLGFLSLLGGMAIGLLAPLEMYCFYLFSEGGRFHYDGFGFGSFMFANIASQIIGYYLIAALLIPLGYGHLKKRRWARRLALIFLWAWLVVGAPLIAVVFIVLLASKDLSLPLALAASALLLISYFVLPGLMNRFYRGRNVRLTFETNDTGAPCWIETVPIPNLVLSSLFLFYIIMLHILILFNGMFPVFGTFYFGMQGIILLDLSIAGMLCLAWGTIRQRLWAWWGAVIGFGLFTFSLIFTLCSNPFSALLAGLAFPAQEVDILNNLPVEGYHIAMLVGLPLTITWVVAVFSKRYFRPGF